MNLAFFFQFGYFGLFLISFLSATLLPLASEFFVVAMPPLGYQRWLIVLFATAGSFLGSLVNYYVGKKGGGFILSRFMEMKPKTLARAERFYQRWGPIALFFSWVPFIGDPLTAVAGTFHVDLRVFSFWVIFGKTLRYLVILGLASRFLNQL
jgi:membrane protein YqaA with SNARE-associated domain